MGPFEVEGTGGARHRAGGEPILHLVNEVTDCSISSIIRFMVTQLDPQRYAWHLGAVNALGNMTQPFRDLGVQVVDFRSGQGLQNGAGTSAVRDGVVRRIRAYVRRHRIAIVHTHTLRARLIAAATLLGVTETRHVDTVHHLYRPVDGRWGWLLTLIDRASYYLTDHLVAVSETMYGEIAPLPFLVGGDAHRLGRVTAIQNAIDCELFHQPGLRESGRAEFGFDSDRPVIGYTGQILALKRLDVLLDAFARVLHRYPKARLLVVGEGDQRPALENTARALGIGHAVTWTGFRQDIPRLLSAIDIFVLPSSNEGMSLSILEAMGAGKPVVVTDVGGAREMVADGETGLLIPPGSVMAAGEALLGLLGNPAMAERLGQAARDTVCTKFGVARMAAAYGELYERLAFRAGSGLQVAGSDGRGADGTSAVRGRGRGMLDS